VVVFPLDQLESTLRALRTSLVIASLVTTAGGAGLGWWSTRRVLRPLTTAADAATTIAAGDLGARLDRSGDRDLDRLARSFDAMAVSLQERIAREARFASDVSHELRTPLAALTAAADVLDRRRDDIPERTRQALDILLSQLRRFDRITLDLLEISKAQATVEDLDLQDVVPALFAGRVASAHGFDAVEVSGDGAPEPRTLRTDPRVLGAVLRNLLRNAEVHAGGATRVTVEQRDGEVVIGVEDAGAGVPEIDRSRIFERFARGHDVGRRPGSGLGLALVTEHVRLLGGRVWVEDAPGGGARFVVALPVEGPT
jgi:signal transduction histidine kinase